MAEFTLVTTHDRLDLCPQVATLINSMWPMSIYARRAMLERSHPLLPCSLVLLAKNLPDLAQEAPPIDRLTTDGQTILGHCRVMSLGGPKGVLFEIVVVDEQHRGKGFGKILMQKAEEAGKAIVYLNTTDKQAFYEHLGYHVCDPVTSGVFGGKVQTLDQTPSTEPKLVWLKKEL
ncbi:hypothetical protein CAOG_001466 [Capsaspora owczarzaki ATCC 30864]|uniref:N-acetyltransferase domain-containing protein n=1 Tax=Capsaspora owczarzaki (strain ATCC 30864) TaxID=595528 RepID=A0A0D2U4R8_CAPO3|nr:hypothetical protein CAOG_001466 [Capsaspora owczarzaki ATCC 30864]